MKHVSIKICDLKFYHCCSLLKFLERAIYRSVPRCMNLFIRKHVIYIGGLKFLTHDFFMEARQAPAGSVLLPPSLPSVAPACTALGLPLVWHNVA